MINGVNLGNWLVLEKWMSPDLFDGDDRGGRDRSVAAPRSRSQAESGSEPTATPSSPNATSPTWPDLGVGPVRIPVPYFVFGDVEPFVGCIEYVDRAFEWAATHGLKIMLDLHTVPGSQNGFDNGGLCGVCRWHRSPDDVEFVLTLLERLTSRYRGHRALLGDRGLERAHLRGVVERSTSPPLSRRATPIRAGSEPVPTDFLKGFYTDAYRRIRAADPDVTIVFHDGFRHPGLGRVLHGTRFRADRPRHPLVPDGVHVQNRGRESR